MKIKALVFLFLFISCFNLVGQDWAPFKRTDTLLNYLSIDSITTDYTYVDTVGPLRYFLPIQSISVDSVLLDSNNYKSIVFKKGVSANELLNSFYERSRLIKGQILGDSAIIKKDYSQFNSIDSRGFNIRFDHRIKQGIHWQLGNSVDYVLKANCDSVYWGNIDSLLADSLALISIQVEDTNANIVTNHLLNNSKIILSKKNGLIRTVSFTNLDTIRFYTLYRGLDKPILLKDHLDFKKGDEIHIAEGNRQTPLPFAPWRGLRDSVNLYKVKINEDSSSNSHVCLKVNYDWWLLNQLVFNKIGNSGWWCANKQNVLSKNESMVLPNGNPSLGFYPVNCLGISRTSGFSKMIIFKSFWNNLYNTTIGQYTDTVVRGDYYNRRRTQYLVGAGIEFYELFGFTGGYDEKAHKIQYVKKGNKSWGTPISFSTTLNEIKDNGKFLLYPNPTKGIVQIDLPNNRPIQQVRIFNLQGSQVEAPLSGNQMDLSALQQGLYVIHIQTTENSWVKKVLKR